MSLRRILNERKETLTIPGSISSYSFDSMVHPPENSITIRLVNRVSYLRRTRPTLRLFLFDPALWCSQSGSFFRYSFEEQEKACKDEYKHKGQIYRLDQVFLREKWLAWSWFLFIFADFGILHFLTSKIVLLPLEVHPLHTCTAAGWLRLTSITVSTGVCPFSRGGPPR